MNFLRKPFRYTYKNACLALVIINVVIFILFEALNILNIPQVETYFALIPPLTIHNKMFWQVFTYQFLHADIWHLLFNMLALFIFGSQLEKKMGSIEFLIFYLLCGTLCGIAGLAIYYFFFLNTFTITVVIGASGAIYAILLGFATLFPSTVIYLWGILPIPAPILILLYTGIEVFSMFFARDNVSHSIHLLGLIWAFLYIVIRFGINPLRVWKNTFK